MKGVKEKIIIKYNNPKKKNKDGNPEYLYITVHKNQFWTTGELLAGAQDLEKFFDNKPNNIIYGINNIPKIYIKKRP